MEMTTLLTPNLVLTAALPVLSDRRKTLLQWLYSFWLRKLSWRTQLSFPLLSVGKVQSWIAKAEAERFPESLTRLPPFPQPPPPWLEQGWHGRWDSNVGVGGPTIAGRASSAPRDPKYRPSEAYDGNNTLLHAAEILPPSSGGWKCWFQIEVSWPPRLHTTRPTIQHQLEAIDATMHDWDRVVSFFRQNLI